MAVQSTLVNSAMSIKYKEGIDALGNDVIKTRKYPNVKATALAADIHLVATTLGTLIKYEVTEILRSDDNIQVNL
jgi:hypothetical protein